MTSAASPPLKRRAALGVATIAVAGALGAIFALRGPASPPPSPSPSVPSAPPAPTAPPASSSAGATAPTRGRAITPELTSAEDEDVELHVFSFRVAEARFDVVDLGMSRDLEGALAQTHASLAVNGGYFAPSTQAEGLVIAAGKTLSPFVPALGGGVIVIHGGRAELVDAANFTPPADADFAIQAKPRLVVGGAVNLRGDDGRKAERTALCVRDEGRSVEAIFAHGKGLAVGGPTLTLLAEMLASRGCEGALNLDGGPSSGAAWQGEARVEVRPPRAAIRHALTIRLAP
jgi:Phosphodiester glycosidase